ncbi:MAG: glycosyltransferase [Kiritimatiellia bacterium]
MQDLPGNTTSSHFPELAVVIPVYNEADDVRRVLVKWLSELKSLEIDFQMHAYNDGSTDSSLAVMKNLEKDESALTVHDKDNTGHGPTILLGYRENRNAEWMFQTDSDGEIPPDSFSALWRERHDHDFLAGRRLDRRTPLPRRAVSLGARLLVRILFGRRTIRDVNIPCRLMRMSAFSPCLSGIPDGTFAPNVLISGYAAARGLRQFETAVRYEPNPTPVTESLRAWRLAATALACARQTLQFARKCRAGSHVK